MKYVLIALLILSILLTLSLVSAVYVSNTVEKTETLLSQALTKENVESAADLVKKATDYWASHQVRFGITMRHDETDAVSDELVMLHAYVTQEDWDDYRGNGALLLKKLEHIHEMVWPKIHNIL